MATYKSTFCPHCKSPLSIHVQTGWNNYDELFGEQTLFCSSCLNHTTLAVDIGETNDNMQCRSRKFFL